MGSTYSSLVDLSLFGAYRKLAHHLPLKNPDLFLGLVLPWLPRNCSEQSKAKAKCGEVDGLWGCVDPVSGTGTTFASAQGSSRSFLLWRRTLKYILLLSMGWSTQEGGQKAARLWDEILHFMSYCKLFPLQPDLGLFWKNLEMKQKSIPFTSDLFAWLSLARQALPVFSSCPKALISCG